MKTTSFFGVRTTSEQFISNCIKAGIYLKGLHGFPTQLTKEQWLWIRTDYYKDIYGDWENYYKCKFLLEGEPITLLTGKEFEPIKGKTLTEQVAEHYKDIGGIAHSPFFGEVILDKKGADDSLAHGIGRKKAIAYAAVKDIIEQGILIDYDFNHKDRNYDSAVVCAPIKIQNDRYICYVTMSKKEKSTRFYLHEVWTEKSLASARSNAVLGQPSHLQGTANILQNILSAKDLIINLTLDANGEPILYPTIV